MASDFDKQIKGIFNTVRSTINPDYAIPKDKAEEPMNVRIQRMKDSADQLSAKLKEINTALSAFTTNLNALTEEVQPYIAQETQAKPASATSEASSDQEAKPVEPASNTASVKTDTTADAPADTSSPAADKTDTTAEAPTADKDDKK